ncbi:MAG: DUF63 family protein [Methanomicrobiales archaeon]|nr:DUF63 family protein [Methanomicrobiales archaeon]
MFREFIYKYYIDPIRYGHPYNVVDTLTYAGILLVSVYLVYKWLIARGTPLDRNFVLSTIPFVVFGGLLRVVEDTGLITSDLRFLLVTPLIFFSVFFIAVMALLAGTYLQDKGRVQNYRSIYAGTGIACVFVCSTVLIVYGLTQGRIGFFVLALISALAAASSIAFWALLRYGLGWKYVSDTLYRMLIFGHMLDASATGYGVDLHEIPYREVHVVGSTLISMTGSGFSMYLLKIGVLIPAVYLLERYRTEGETGLYHIVILVMILLGLAPGIRDMVRMILYV